MSEETKTPAPSLRLKPRLSPPGGDSPEVAPAASEGMKFRLKPKTDLAAPAPSISPETLSALRDPDATIPPMPRSSAFTPPKPVAIPPAVAPVFAAPPPPAAPKPAAPSPAAPAFSAAVPAAPVPAASVPAAPAAAAPKPATPSRSPIPGYTAPPFPKGARTKVPFNVPHLKAPVDGPALASEPAAAKAPRKRGGLIAAAVSLVVFGVCGYFAWQHFMAPAAPSAAPAAAQPSAATLAPANAAPASGPTPSDTLNKIAAMPGNAIQKAQDALAARRANGQGRVDALASGDDVPAKKAAAEPAKSGTATAMTQVAPNLTATTELEAGPQASPAFVAWSVNIKVNGVFQGSPARAMINGRLTRTGETVEPMLGIVFDSVDAERKLLIFRDAIGAKVSRKY